MNITTILLLLLTLLLNKEEQNNIKFKSNLCQNYKDKNYPHSLINDNLDSLIVSSCLEKYFLKYPNWPNRLMEDKESMFIDFRWASYIEVPSSVGGVNLIFLMNKEDAMLHVKKSGEKNQIGNKKLQILIFFPPRIYKNKIKFGICGGSIELEKSKLSYARAAEVENYFVYFDETEKNGFRIDTK